MIAPKSASKSGSIPACAGEPEGEQGRRRRRGVYPRVRGGTVKKV